MRPLPGGDVVEVIQQSGTIGVHTHPPPPRARRLHAHGSASPQRAQRSSRPHLTVQHVPASLSPLDRDHTIGASRPSACASSEPRPHSGTTAEDSSTYDRPTLPATITADDPHLTCHAPALPNPLCPSRSRLPPQPCHLPQQQQSLGHATSRSGPPQTPHSSCSKTKAARATRIGYW
ncbi:MAG: hypothetical protein JWR78_4732 [Mycobacterium sp.]|jgi:hypothetical protein|nr:hypothetical protein [Mycobacterium sp.]